MRRETKRPSEPLPRMHLQGLENENNIEIGGKRNTKVVSAAEMGSCQLWAHCCLGFTLILKGKVMLIPKIQRERPLT